MNNYEKAQNAQQVKKATAEIRPGDMVKCGGLGGYDADMWMLIKSVRVDKFGRVFYTARNFFKSGYECDYNAEMIFGDRFQTVAIIK